METASRRSGLSMASSYRRKFNGTVNKNGAADGPVDAINE